MGSYPEVADLRLVDAIARHGSVGAAARELLVSQPSASQRLAALERRCGVRLFDRDTTGARPTAAGQQMVAEAGHMLGHLERVFEWSRAAAESESITVGTIPSLAMLVFPALHVALPDLRTSQVVDHGPRLVDWVAEGSLDAAFVAIAGQIELPIDDRTYRDAQLAAGIVEGRLHLCAYATGASASGMTFLDSEVPELLGEPSSLVTLLFTCVGVPAYRSRRGGAPGAPSTVRMVQPRIVE